MKRLLEGRREAPSNNFVNRNNLNLLVTAFLIAIAFSIVSAQARVSELEYYGIESSINDDMTVRTVLSIKFKEPVDAAEFMLDYKAYNLTTASASIQPYARSWMKSIKAE